MTMGGVEYDGKVRSTDEGTQGCASLAVFLAEGSVFFPRRKLSP